jgi:hypothetical protein
MGQTAGLAMMGASMGMGLASAKNNAKAQQNVANYNAQISEIQADDAIVRGRKEEMRHRLGVRGMIGSQRAAFAAGGVDVNDGSALDVQMDTARWGEVDAQTIRTNALREAWGYRVAARDSTYRGELARFEGRQQQMSTIVTGAGKLASAGYFGGGMGGDITRNPSRWTSGRD